MVQTIESAWKSCAEEPPGYEFRVREQLSQLIFLLSQHFAPVPLARSAKLQRDGERIKLMLEYIHQNYAAPLTTAAIAKIAAISESECLRKG